MFDMFHDDDQITPSVTNQLYTNLIKNNPPERVLLSRLFNEQHIKVLLGLSCMVRF